MSPVSAVFISDPFGSKHATGRSPGGTAALQTLDAAVSCVRIDNVYAFSLATSSAAARADRRCNRLSLFRTRDRTSDSLLEACSATYALTCASSSSLGRAVSSAASAWSSFPVERSFGTASRSSVCTTSNSPRTDTPYPGNSFVRSLRRRAVCCSGTFERSTGPLLVDPRGLSSARIGVPSKKGSFASNPPFKPYALTTCRPACEDARASALTASCVRAMMDRSSPSCVTISEVASHPILERSEATAASTSLFAPASRRVTSSDATVATLLTTELPPRRAAQPMSRTLSSRRRRDSWSLVVLCVGKMRSVMTVTPWDGEGASASSSSPAKYRSSRSARLVTLRCSGVEFASEARASASAASFMNACTRCSTAVVGMSVSASMTGSLASFRTHSSQAAAGASASAFAVRGRHVVQACLVAVET